MKSKTSFARLLFAFLVALVFGAALGSVVQTQFNLAGLVSIGVSIDMPTRVATTVHDLRNFAPIYAVIFGAGFLVSQAVAIVLVRFYGQGSRTFWCVLGAVLGLWFTFKVVDMIAPMPTLIAATRSSGGLVALLGASALSGALFSRLSAPRLTHYGRGGALAVAALCVAGLAGAPAPVQAQQAAKPQVSTFAEGLNSPWSMAFLPDGQMLVTEKPGRLRLVGADGKVNPTPIANLPKVHTGGQAGLFDVVLAPDFEQSRQLFISYACGTRQANHACLSSARLNGTALEDVKEVFRSQPAKSGNAHYGGRIVFLPDGTLTLSLGDGYNYREQSQSTKDHFGTIVRINRDGSVPSDNPFANREGGALPEIYSFGHRNVQGMFFDPVSKRLIAHEHGPRGGDEVNIVEPGKNYGWPAATYGIDYNGAQISPYTDRPGTVQPAIKWVPSIAPSGLTVYDGDLFPQWKGSLLVGALAARQVSRVELGSDGKAREVEVLFKDVGERIRDVRTGPDGAIYLATDNTEGRILRVTPAN